MYYLDLFHGIGGFALGAYWAGMKFEKHYCSDVDPYCQELYAKRFPDSIQLGDITKIETGKLPKGEWIITGGFPCQDISIAGKGTGIHGERSGLWFEYWRIINDLRPRFAIMENVGMLVHRGLREVLGSLAEIGYNAEWQDIRASDVGAPHRRERIWIIAYSGMSGNRASRNGIDGNGAKENEKRENKSFFESCGQDEDVAYTRCEHGERNEVIREHEKSNRPGDAAESERPIKCDSEGIVAYTAKEQGLFTKCDWWTVEPAMGLLVDGLPDSVGGFEGRLASQSYKRVNQLKGLGNSIVPQIAKLLFEQI